MPIKLYRLKIKGNKAKFAQLTRLIADELNSMDENDKESLPSCVKELTELAKRVTYWVESIKSSKSYSSLNTLRLKFEVVKGRLRTIVICMEANNLPALATRLEREYGDLIKMTEYFDNLCKDPENKDIKPGDLETAPQELRSSAAYFVSLLDEIANQILSATEETINPAEKQAETRQNIAPAKSQRIKKITGRIFKNFKKTSASICALVFFLAALLAIFSYLGWLDQFKAFIKESYRLAMRSF